jgi:hypothetical protein
MFLAGIAMFGLLLLRSAHSFTRLPADPGYDYILQARRQGFEALAQGDPYFHVAARAIALTTSVFPLFTQAVVLALLVHIIWVISALVITTVVRREYNSTNLAVLCGLALIMVPHASESGIGNVGNVKWPLFAALILTSASNRLEMKDLWWVAPLTLLTGLTQPLSLLVLLPLAIRLLARRKLKSPDIGFLAILIFTVVVQLSKVGLSSAAAGQTNKVMMPWSGMGFFWWTGLAAPSLIALGTMTVGAILYLKRLVESLFIPTLSATTIVVALVSYRMGGIGDRYFIVPVALVTITALVLTRELINALPKYRSLFGACLATGLLIPCIYWFSTGWYMTSGPTWHSEIRRAEAICGTGSVTLIQVAITPSGAVNFSCVDILNE